MRRLIIFILLCGFSLYLQVWQMAAISTDCRSQIAAAYNAEEETNEEKIKELSEDISEDISEEKPSVIQTASCSQEDVQRAIDSASDGDTILLPEGTATWTNPVTMSGNLTFKGAGIGKTTITLSSTSSFCIACPEGKPFRLTGCTFIFDKSKSIDVSGNGRNWRIDHCEFNSNTWNEGITIRGIPYGLFGCIDNCLIHNTQITPYDQTGIESWKAPLPIGTSNAVYIENCIFDMDGGTVVDGNCGFRYVFRNNTVINGDCQCHSLQNAFGDNEPFQRGTRSFEIYDNTFIARGGPVNFGMFLRGGTGVVYNNVAKYESGTYKYRSMVQVDNVRSCRECNSPLNMCDGLNPIDGNIESNGWPCLDQIGRSTDYGAGEDRIPQESYPLYVWNNKIDDEIKGVEVVNCETNKLHITENRDYFLNYRQDYVPYPFPHPITVDDQSGKALNLEISQTDSSITLNWNTVDGADKYLILRNWEEIEQGITGMSWSDTIPDDDAVYMVYAISDSDSKIIAAEGVVVGKTDSEPPSTPSSFKGTVISDTTIDLSWIQSADNIAIDRYYIYRNGTKIGSSETTNYSDTNLDANKLYRYTVIARDKAGNLSQASSAVIKAATCIQDDVQEAVDLASNGDMVLIPVGEAVWTNPADYSYGFACLKVDKPLIIKGAGEDKTIIIDDTDIGYDKHLLSINWNSDDNTFFRMSSMTFRQSRREHDSSPAIVLSASGNGIHSARLDHIRFEKIGIPLNLNTDISGVIDHIYVDSGKISFNAVNWDEQWSEHHPIGSGNVWYIEDSTFTYPDWADGVTDSYNGGRFVLRNNRILVPSDSKFSGFLVGCHGYDSSSRSGMYMEVYNNTFLNNDPSKYLKAVQLRGGTGVVFNNRISGYNWNKPIAITNYRSCTGYSNSDKGYCDGSVSGDGNIDHGWPCKDQIGRSGGMVNGLQTSEPLYVWNNMLDNNLQAHVSVYEGSTGDCSYTTLYHIKKNRDYYEDIAKPDYVPYVYPHPLTLTDYSSNRVLRVMSTMDGSTLTLSWDNIPDAENYTVFKNWQKIETTSVTTYSESKPADSTIYMIYAYDAQGNIISAECVKVDTDNNDTIAPSVPTELDGRVISSSLVNLW